MANEALVASLAFPAAADSNVFSISERMTAASIWLTVATFWFPRFGSRREWPEFPIVAES
jgi:hypothetical protein